MALSKTRIIVLLLGLSLGLDSGIFFLPDMGAAFADFEGVVSDEEFIDYAGDYADTFGNRHSFYDGVDGPYVDNGDGTVTDIGMDLMWQQSNDSNLYEWEEACAYCENLTLAGYGDWELPGIYQLVSLLNNNLYENINPNYFNTEGLYYAEYCSGSTYARYTDRAWIVDFNSGYVSKFTKTYDYYVRCVRSGSSDPLLICTVNGSVVDDVTGSAIPGAGLSFISTGFSREYQTGNDGAFQITDVPAGTYQVQVSADGYQSESFGSITLTPGLGQTLTASP